MSLRHRGKPGKYSKVLLLLLVLQVKVTFISLTDDFSLLTVRAPILLE